MIKLTSLIQTFQKLVGWSQPEIQNNIIKQEVKFKTVEPDVRLSFDKWSKKFKVSSRFNLLEDSEWLQKVRNLNDDGVIM
jgi:hypothetical protein